MIIFKKVRWRNFLSTGNQWTEVDLVKSKTTLVVGNNGSGKSTLIDAISYALFNKPFRKINKPQLVNSITNKNCCVEVEFTLGQTEYKIVRGIKPNIFEIWQDDQLVNQDAASRDYQDIVEKHILKISHKSFCQVVILGSSTYVPFMQLPSLARREIIEDLLDLQIFTVMNGVLKQKIIDNDIEINTNTANATLLEEKIRLVKEHIDSIQADQQATIDAKTNQIKECQNQIEFWTIENNGIRSQMEDLAEESKDLVSLQNKLREIEIFEGKVEQKVSAAKKSLEFYEQNDKCPTCNQLIVKELRETTIQNKNTKVNQLEEGLNILKTKKANLETKIGMRKRTLDHYNEFNLQSGRLYAQIESVAQQIDTIEKELEAVRNKQKETTTERIDQYETELAQLSEQYNKLQQQRKIFDVLQYVLKDGGIKSKIIRQYIPVINKFINKYLSSMDFFVDFSLDENFNETIKSRFRDAFSYESFSEGEKFRINLAILFAWRAIAKLRNSINTNLLIMDEVMDSSLDANGTEEFLKILLQLTQDTNTFIISHKTDILYDKFDRVLVFEKKKNFSLVVEK